jgi:hypothetical protein
MTKYQELLKYSDPARVSKNALEYFGENVPIYVSSKPNKKYMLRDNTGKIVHFGEIGFFDFTRHLNQELQRKYLKRAMAINGNWYKNKYSPNMLAINLLWM